MRFKSHSPRRRCWPLSKFGRVEPLESRSLLAGVVVISEVVAAGSSLLDEDGDTPDWIELQNVGDEAVDLGGLYLSDEASNLTKWQFPVSADAQPGVVIEPNGFLIVYASSKDRSAPNASLHTNFKLTSLGETLSLVAADGVTIVDAFQPFPTQTAGVSYGRASTETVSPFIDGDSVARFVAANSSDDAANWSSPTFSDANWNDATASIGYAQNPVDSPLDAYGTVANYSPLGSNGNQAFRGRIGLDFVVERPITVTSLGLFDDESDGFFSRLQVHLWSRDDRGTPDDRRDDFGLEVLATENFRGTRSPLIGGSRYTQLSQPLELQPGNYSIVATGFSHLDRNAAGFAGSGVTELADTDALRFAGSRVGLTTIDFPTVVGLGPPNHYAAATFTFKTANDVANKPNATGQIEAHRAPTVVGNAETGGNLGLDFQVIRPIIVTELGVFDSGQDGIAGALGVSVWSRTTGEQLTGLTVIGDRGTIEPGSGNRFVPLNEPLLLEPGDYTVLATGFFDEDPFLHSQRNGGQLSKLNDGDGAIQFKGTGRYNVAGPSFLGPLFGPERFLEEPYHRLPPVQDVGPVNRWSAGTIKYEVAILNHAQTDVAEQLAEPSNGAFLRIPFDVGEVESLDALRLNVNYDDGFVAYLNGTEVLRVNAPDVSPWDSFANAARTDQQTIAAEAFDLTSFLPLLTANSQNVFAVHLLSAGADDPDLIFDPVLDGITDGEVILGYFVEPTPLAANGKALLGLATTPEIVTAGGIVDPSRLDADGNLLVAIQHATDGASVYYTTDGSAPTEMNGSLYTAPLAIDRTTVIRAVSLKDGFQSSGIATSSFLFLDDVVRATGVPAGFPSHWNAEPADYGISQDPADLAAIAGDLGLGIEEAREVIKESLSALPTMSLVGDMESIFGLPSGFYTNPFPRGRDYEHPASVEYFEADGTRGFQIDAGLRMMGWTSRIPGVSPKHSMRLVFRDEYGNGRLEYPLFDGPITSFDSLALRSNSRDSWNSDYPFGPGGGVWDEFERGSMRSVASYIRDQWSREVQSDMGMLTAEGTYVHLYINGVYWGVYNPTERPDGAWTSDHLGGNEDDYDSVVFCNPAPRAAHGDLVMWDQLLASLDDGVAGDAAYQRLFGNNPDGTRNPEFPVLLELDNFIDYMISGQYDAADDWPCNFYAYRERGQADEGFRFTTWDNDLALPMGQVNANMITPDLFGVGEGSPMRIHAALVQNADYAMRYADRVQMHFFGDGALTPAASAERWQRIAAQVAPGIIAESARWGDYRRDVDEAGPAELYTKSGHWDVFINDMLENYFPARTGVVLDQLRRVGLFPDIDAPSLSRNGGSIGTDTELTIDGQGETVYYTLDGSDPRSNATNLTLFNDNSVKQLWIPNGPALGTSWTTVEFNNLQQWTSGRGGVGFDYDGGDSLWTFIDNNVDDMIDFRLPAITSPSIYIRIPFNVSADDLANLDFLKLKMRSDDGFIAYLNGQVVSRSNAPRNATWNSFATGDISDGISKTFRNFDLSFHVDKLVAGENVLAIHGMSSSATDFDLLFGAELVAGTAENGTISSATIEYAGPISLDKSLQVNARVYKNGEWSSLTQASFATDKPLRVSEIYYNPPGQDETTEFIELVNVGTEAVDLTGVHFSDGIEYEFVAGDSHLSLAPGQYLAIAKDPAALRASRPDLPAAVIFADRGFVGQLNNAGEKITLADRGGSIIQEFSYDDTWYPTTDGDGDSLTIVNARAERDAWDVASGWRASGAIGGTPGTGDTLMPVRSVTHIDRLPQLLRQDHIVGESVTLAAGEQFGVRREIDEDFGVLVGAIALAGNEDIVDRERDVELRALLEWVEPPSHVIDVPLKTWSANSARASVQDPSEMKTIKQKASDAVREVLFSDWDADDL